MASKNKADKFSVTKAVKSNARDRVGQPPPAKVIIDKPRQEKRLAKHKPRLNDLLQNGE